MFSKIISINLLFILLYLSAKDSIDVYNRELFFNGLILFSILSFFLGPSILKKEEKKIEVLPSLEEEKEEFHNDFKRVGSSENPHNKIR